MKTIIRVVLAGGVLCALLFAATGCKAATAQPAAAANSSQNQQGAPGGAGGTMGVITTVSDTSITIAVMPSGGFGGQRPQGTGQSPWGTGQPPSGMPSGMPQQPLPSGSAGANAPAGTPGTMPTMDTSSWQKQTFTIDSKTKITQFQMPGAITSQTSALKVSDLTVGETVSITARSGAAGAADTISVMQGNFGPGGQPNGPTTPTATAKS